MKGEKGFYGTMLIVALRLQGNIRTQAQKKIDEERERGKKVLHRTEHKHTSVVAVGIEGKYGGRMEAKARHRKMM